MRPIYIIILLLFVSACASNKIEDTINLTVPPKDMIVHSCMYDAMDETLVTHKWAWWDSKENNCASTSPHRGRILLKHTEFPKNNLCAQFFKYSQTYFYSDNGNNKWIDYTSDIVIACLNTKMRWVFYRDVHTLDIMVLNEILN